MSGIYIKDMEMPKRCEDCFCYRHNAECDYAYCNISSVKVLGNANARLNNCPLIPVPNHGRLVDGDKIVEGCKDKEGRYVSQFAAAVGETVESAPTIIPASGGDAE